MADYTTGYNQDVYFVVNSTVGDLNQIYDFLIQNATFSLSSVPVNYTFNYEVQVSTPPIVASIPPDEKKVGQIYLSINNQTIFDITLMTLTDLNQVFTLMLDSSFTNVNTLPKSGTVFNFNQDNATDNILIKYLAENEIVFNTGEIKTDPPRTTFFLQQENGFYILQENGAKIILT